jgi:hypothetical protein
VVRFCDTGPADELADATILGYQYFGQIILQTTIVRYVCRTRKSADLQSYGLQVSGPVMKHFEELYGVNATFTGNDTLRDANRLVASSHLVNIIQRPVEEALSGILWLFPCAVSQGRHLVARPS